jgi:hypothetical protein
MKIAYFSPLRPRSGSIAEYSERLLPELSLTLEVGVFVDGYVPESPRIRERCRVHDLRAMHYRKLLWQYDVVVYQVASSGPEACPDSYLGAYPDAYMEEPVREWPGIVVLHEVDPSERVGSPHLCERVLERALAVVAGSAGLEARLRDELSYTAVFACEPAGDPGALVRAYLRIFDAALTRAGRWLEPLLETACAEIPGFLPGDRSAPWRAQVDELVGLAGSRSRTS